MGVVEIEQEGWHSLLLIEPHRPDVGRHRSISVAEARTNPYLLLMLSIGTLRALPLPSPYLIGMATTLATQRLLTLNTISTVITVVLR